MNAGCAPSSLHQATVATEVPVRATGLGKSIDGRPILQDVDLDVRAGEFVAVLGANGAGKSTLLKVLATLTHASTGTLQLFGRRVGRESADLRARVGMIGHQPMLYRDLTARENLEFFGRLYGIQDPVGRADRLLQVMGLDNRADDPVKAFSRGMVQRVAIARALVHDPEMILADEPFDGLDAPSVAATEELLEHLHRAGKTIVLVNHDVRQTLRIARRVVLMRRGRIVAHATADRFDAAHVLAELGGGA